jgi:Zona pellucida-like domain
LGEAGVLKFWTLFSRDLEITTSVIKSAPTPALKVGVRQGGNLISGDLNVSPGTPLSMEIYLDKDSAPVYGLGVTHMQVTDTEAQEETIIYNGCSVDPYLFENFETEDGDFLKAKFKAFKFPDSTYVQFRGTVNVCLDRCKGVRSKKNNVFFNLYITVCFSKVECSNGQIGFGRKRREIMQSAMDPNKIFEISMTTFIKVNYDEEADQSKHWIVTLNRTMIEFMSFIETLSEIEQKLKQLKITNQKLARNSRAGNVFESVQDFKTTEMNSNDDSAKVEETLLYKVERTEQMLNSSSKNSLAICSYLVILSVLSYVMNTVL